MTVRLSRDLPRSHRLFVALMLVFTVVHVSAQPRVSGAEQRLEADLLTNGTQVRAAFTNVVAESRKSTVEVWSGDVQVSLGVIISEDGQVLTKASELLNDLVCHFPDESTAAAKVIAIDRKFDLALLQIERKGLQPVVWADKDQTEVGRWLATPGLDYLPEAVGVVSVGQLKVPPFRGKGILGIADTDESDRGPKILKINPLSSASRFGLRDGDVILQVADQFVRDSDGLEKSLGRFRQGDSLFLRILRGENLLLLQVTLDGDFSRRFERQGIQNRMGGDISIRRAGFDNVLQHDTVLRPYQCGGVLVDLSGKAVGLNIARAGRTETFALPVSVVRKRIEELRSGSLDVDYTTPAVLIKQPAESAVERTGGESGGSSPTP